MKHALKIALAAAALSAVAAPALAQTSATQSTSATVKIVQPITLTKDADLAFGTVVKPTTGSNTVTISTGSDTPALSGAGDAALATSTTARAAFTVGGEGGSTFSITVPSSVTMTRSGGSETLSVTLTASGSSGTLSGSIGSAGSATFKVGGAFTVASTTVSGNYSGSFNTTVAYN
ncbi:MAG: DUF4402 domain-containing protein [Parcubacteria group bacterium]